MILWFGHTYQALGKKGPCSIKQGDGFFFLSNMLCLAWIKTSDFVR